MSTDDRPFDYRIVSEENPTLRAIYTLRIFTAENGLNRCSPLSAANRRG